MRAIFLGSIGVLAETSDVQRRAYNAAFERVGLDWTWDRKTYSTLLEFSGGKARLALLSSATNTQLDDDKIAAIHSIKTQIAGDLVRSEAKLRPGVADLISGAKKHGLMLGLVTSTSAANVEAILDAGGDQIGRDDFDVIVTQEAVAKSKPDPEVYLYALRSLGLEAFDALAIEDTAVSIAAAKRAGLRVVATPGALTSSQDFHEAECVLDDLTKADVLARFCQPAL